MNTGQDEKSAAPSTQVAVLGDVGGTDTSPKERPTPKHSDCSRTTSQDSRLADFDRVKLN